MYENPLQSGTFYREHWWLRDLEIAAQLYDPKNAQRNHKIAKIGKSTLCCFRVFCFVLLFLNYYS